MGPSSDGDNKELRKVGIQHISTRCRHTETRPTLQYKTLCKYKRISTNLFGFLNHLFSMSNIRDILRLITRHTYLLTYLLSFLLACLTYLLTYLQMYENIVLRIVVPEKD
jgi:hypothetical protein